MNFSQVAEGESTRWRPQPCALISRSVSLVTALIFGDEVGGGGETKAMMKKKVRSLTFASAVLCCQVKIYFLLSLQTRADSVLAWLICLALQFLVAAVNYNIRISHVADIL